MAGRTDQAVRMNKYRIPTRHNLIFKIPLTSLIQDQL